MQTKGHSDVSKERLHNWTSPCTWHMPGHTPVPFTMLPPNCLIPKTKPPPGNTSPVPALLNNNQPRGAPQLASLSLHLEELLSIADLQQLVASL